MELNKIYNENCLTFIPKLDNHSIDLLISSPPYNTSISRSQDKRTKDIENKKKHTRAHSYSRYDSLVDNKTIDQYACWVRDIFNAFEPKLKPNGIIAWNVSYGVGSDNGDEFGINSSMWRSVQSIINETPFCIADYICWNKSNAIPLSIGNKLSRVCEPLFIFCRKNELDTYHCNTEKTGKIGQTMYKTPFHNRIYTKYNNDAQCPLNRATYSSEFVEKIIDLYGKEGGTIFDPFMGSGTTAVGAIECGLNYIGTEISADQVKWAENRIKRLKGNSLWF